MTDNKLEKIILKETGITIIGTNSSIKLFTKILKKELDEKELKEIGYRGQNKTNTELILIDLKNNDSPGLEYAKTLENKSGVFLITGTDYETMHAFRLDEIDKFEGTNRYKKSENIILTKSNIEDYPEFKYKHRLHVSKYNAKYKYEQKDKHNLYKSPDKNHKINFIKR